MKHKSLVFFARILCFAAVCKVIVLCAGPAQAADGMALAKAMAAAQDGKIAAAERAPGTLERKIAQWELLQQPNVTAPFETYTAFLSSAKGWPMLTAIQLRAEDVLPENLPDAEVAAWFKDRAPLTSRAVIRYASALDRMGQHAAAVRAVHDFFATRDFGGDGAVQIMAAFPNWLSTDDISARADRLIWEGNYTAASDLLAYLPADARRIPAARIALLQGGSAADQLLSSLSDDEQNDPGIAFARAHWRRELGFDDSAAVILARIQTPATREEDVAKERGALSRRLFERADIGGAFAVAAAQPAVNGSEATQNLWFAGWLALRFKQDPATASKFFKAFNDHVQTPVSRARGAYWLARTAETAGEASVATQWYQVAAQYGTTFYGQLSAQKLGQAIAIPPRMAEAMQSPILNDERLHAAQLLAEANDVGDARLFFHAVLNDADDEQAFAALANWSNQHNQPHWAVLAGKGAQQHGFAGLRAAYPILAKSIREEFDARLDPALAHGLIRQESEFDVGACSHSGALGLMQLMPATAKNVANKMGVSYSKVALTAQPSHNVQLGSHYIADQIDSFGNPYLAIAAYNAGPGRVRQWLATYGDPRNPNVDIVDWIESIPAYETRNYVQRVTENQNVYTALLSARDVARN